MEHFSKLWVKALGCLFDSCTLKTHWIISRRQQRKIGSQHSSAQPWTTVSLNNKRKLCSASLSCSCCQSLQSLSVGMFGRKKKIRVREINHLLSSPWSAFKFNSCIIFFRRVFSSSLIHSPKAWMSSCSLELLKKEKKNTTSSHAPFCPNHAHLSAQPCPFPLSQQAFSHCCWIFYWSLLVGEWRRRVCRAVTDNRCRASAERSQGRLGVYDWAVLTGMIM